MANPLAEYLKRIQGANVDYRSAGASGQGLGDPRVLADFDRRLEAKQMDAGQFEGGLMFKPRGEFSGMGPDELARRRAMLARAASTRMNVFGPSGLPDISPPMEVGAPPMMPPPRDVGGPVELLPEIGAPDTLPNRRRADEEGEAEERRRIRR